MAASALPGGCDFTAVRPEDCNVVPTSHVWPDRCRPSLQHDDYADNAEIPVIDLASYRNGDMAAKNHVASQVRQACLDWGFFQIINHNFSQNLIERVRNQAFQFFNLPLEIKKKVVKAPGEFTGFGHATVKEGDVQPWAEGFYLNDFSKVDHVSRTVWPHRYNKEFADSYREYNEGMKLLCKQLMDIIIQSLHVTSTEHFEKYLSGGSGLFRWNYYPACPEPHKTLGMNVHTDFTLLTVLHLGNIGGLQVQRATGTWVAVKPRQGAFAVNIGDMLQVLTNGLYKSVPHRAVVNKIDARLSLAYLFLPTSDVEVVAAPELLEDGIEPLYIPFKLDYYTKVKQAHFLNTLSDHFSR